LEYKYNIETKKTMRKDGDSPIGKRDLPKANLYGNKIEKV